jgi:pimeloyl-ACP methyl ester carboxylesterase
MLRRWIENWELSIYADDLDDRRPQAFGWGLDEVEDLIPGPLDHLDPEKTLVEFGRMLSADGDAFYRVAPLQEESFDGHRLSFASPLPSVHAETARASARLFESSRASGRAVIVIPQWNSNEDSHVQACKILNAFGMTALRLTLPFHENRRPSEMLRADPMVSPVIGQTLQEIRRAVLEVRQLVTWLWDRGYDRIGLLGSSLGSCIAYLACAHEPRVRAMTLNHAAAYFADVVWEGLVTEHVRRSLESHVDLLTLRQVWAPISPIHFAPRLARSDLKTLVISGAYDSTFLPSHAQPLIDALRLEGADLTRVVLPCGHYTLGRPPFYLIDAFLIATFLRRGLSRKD